MALNAVLHISPDFVPDHLDHSVGGFFPVLIPVREIWIERSRWRGKEGLGGRFVEESTVRSYSSILVSGFLNIVTFFKVRLLQSR